MRCAPPAPQLRGFRFVLQRLHVDHEAVFHVTLQHALVRLVDVAHRDHLDVADDTDRKSTRLNSSHMSISYAVFCLKKKKIYYTSQKSSYTSICFLSCVFRSL